MNISNAFLIDKIWHLSVLCFIIHNQHTIHHNSLYLKLLYIGRVADHIYSLTIRVTEMAQPNIATDATDIHWPKKMNFAYCFRPVYYVSRIFGYMPFTIIYDSNGAIQRPKIRAFDFIWFILSVLIQTLPPIFYVQNEALSIYYGTSFILSRIDIILVTFWMIYIIVSLVMDMWNRFILIDILKRINNIDEEVREPTLKKI